MIFLETDRLRLRNVAARDAQVMYDYRNQERCARYQRGQTKDYPGIAALVERRSADVLSVEAPFLVAVAEKDSDELVGEIVVMPNEGTISLGYTISYRHHRRGYAFEALSALIDLLHARWPEWDFVSFTDPANRPSMELLKKLGYRDMGHLPTRDSRVFGKWLTPATEAEIAQAVEQTGQDDSIF
jgi:RimJ/RimL family protein N-acetyltransferase